IYISMNFCNIIKNNFFFHVACSDINVFILHMQGGCQHILFKKLSAHDYTGWIDFKRISLLGYY
ncbi:hypothetical protein V7161_30035, partial [Neobacillus drentensis]|uniref:hypothetical protein n=1 Tax=Neobacillus drentensis TaxID=220684 RepID=UPI00300208F7